MTMGISCTMINSPIIYNLQSKSFRDINLQQQPNTTETAQYIADMVLELRNMAVSSEHKILKGLLEATFYEASSAANRVEIPPDQLERLRELNKASVA